MRNIFGAADDKARDKDTDKKIVDDKKLILRKEELDISKDKIKIGDVELSKEIIEEQKIVNVPVTHEEVIIERVAIDNELSDSPIIDNKEIIRIPVSEERIEIGKHTVVTGEVSAYKREVEETKEVNETLKREEAHVYTDGDPNIVNEKKGADFH